MKTPNWIKDAYRGTDINWTKSQGEIHKRLGDLGIYDVRFTNMKDKFCVEFLVQLSEDEKPRAVRILTPLKESQDDARREKELNIAHRMLLNHIKAKFIAIGKGLVEFEKEFMAHLVITDKEGNSRTMGEALLPQYRKNIDSGENKDFKLLD